MLDYTTIEQELRTASPERKEQIRQQLIARKSELETMPQQQGPLQRAILGGIQGFASGKVPETKPSTSDLAEKMFMEDYKGRLEKQRQQELLDSLGGSGRVKSVNVGGATIEVPLSEEEQTQKTQQEAKDLETKERIKQVSKARKDLDTYTSDAMQSLTAIDKLEREAKNLPKFQRGTIEQIGAKFSTGVSKLAKDKDITRYLGVVAQELIPAARKIMEEKGPITEYDVARVEEGLGDLTAPLEDKVFLLNELRDKIKKALKNKQQVAEISEDEFANKYKDLYIKAFAGNEKPSEQKDPLGLR